MIYFFVFQLTFFVLVQSKIEEIQRKDSQAFLRNSLSSRSKFEQVRETTESTRESCLDEYRQQRTIYRRREGLSPFCTKYCAETNDCDQANEQAACVNPMFPSWPSRTIKFIQKFQRICYVRITEVVRYDQGEQMCEKYGMQLANIDNIPLLEHLKRTHMFNTTCKVQCPEARGYYIGLKRQTDTNDVPTTKWIWSNNETWTQNETNCNDDYSRTSFANGTFLCYVDSKGQKRVTVWNTGEPNDFRSNNFQRGEQCVEIIARPDKQGSIEQIGKLNDIPCNKPTLGVICQMDDLKPVNATRFEYFATIVGLNDTEPEDDDLLNSLFANFGGPIAPNIDALAAMAAALERLLILPSFTNNQATNVLNVVDQLVDVTGQVEVEDTSLKKVTNKLLHFLDLFPAKIQTDNQTSTSFKYENMNTSLVNLDFDQWKDNDQWIPIMSENTDAYPNTIIQLNMRVLRAQLTSTDRCRIIETIFSNFNLFPQMNQSEVTNEKTQQLLGVPISYQIANWTATRTEEDLVRFQIRVAEVNQSRNVSCAYWSFDRNNGSWVVDSGCRFEGYVDNYAQCYCNHLTHFALLMLPETKVTMKPLSAAEEFILTFVTYIGIALSIFGLVITLITYALFRCSQKNRLHSALFMLCLSILFVNCLYIPFSLTKPHLFDAKRNTFCNIIGFLFHYFFLTSFMWMFIMAAIQYMHFVRIFNSHVSHFFLKASFVGWIVPVLFPSLVVSIGTNGGYTGESRCWINDKVLLYVTFLGPISLIILCNLILFVFILKSLFRHDPAILTYQNNRSKLQFGAALCCFVSIGCTWLFGILVLLRPLFVHQLIFCISNSLQGFLIFLFHVYLSKPKRELWQTFFIQRGFHQRPHSSSGHTGLLLTASNSSTANISGLTRPVKFRFTSTPSTGELKETSAAINPTFTDYNGHNNNNATSKDQVQASRHSHAIIRTQPEFLHDRIQRAKLEMNKYYA